MSSGYDEAQAQKTVDRFRAFLEANKDQIIALKILYGRPYAQRRLTYEALEDLRDALKRPPWLLEPVNIWRAYKRLNDARVRGNATRILTDIVMLVRFALDKDEVLEPLPAKDSRQIQSLARPREERRAGIFDRTACLAQRDPRSLGGQRRRNAARLAGYGSVFRQRRSGPGAGAVRRAA